MSLIRRATGGALRHGSIFAVLIMLGASNAGAQRICLAPTASAQSSVERFLQRPSEAVWRETHGITAAHVGELQSLTDVDSTVCRRMDSVFVRPPVYYFRAGTIIIASNPLNTTPDPVTGRIRVRGGPTVVLFDGAGTPIYVPGSAQLTGPTNFRPASVIDGRVVLTWTNQTSDAVNFQLQRSTGGAAFANQGAQLPTTATSTVDSTVVTGTAYTYRIASIGSGGSIIYLSDPVTITVTDVGTVARAATGLLFRDQFNRSDGAAGADWTVESGTWTITNNALQIGIGAGQNAVIRLGALAARKDFHVQLLNSRSQLANYAAIYARRSGSTLYMADLGSTTDGSQPSKPRMHRQTNGGYAALGYGTFASVANTLHRINYSVLGSSHKFWAQGALQVSVTDATAANDINGNLALNVYGQAGPGTVRFDDLVVCSSRTVTITGLPNGYKLRVANIVSSGAVNGGAVSVDVLGAQLPIAQIEILNAADVVVKTHAPSDGVWGGDSYSLAPAP